MSAPTPSTRAPTRPWGRVPVDVAKTLRPHLADAIDEVIRTVTTEVPIYAPGGARGPQAPIRRGLVAGVRIALERLVDILGTRADALADATDLYERLGAAEFRSGRPLEDLLSAYRVGATATWHAFSRAALQHDLSPEVIAALAEACFAYINEISGASTSGYARAQAQAAGERDRLRSELVTLVISGEGATPRMADLARRCRWPVPEQVRVLLLPDDDTSPGSLDRLDRLPGVLTAATDSGGIALVADEPGPGRQAIRRALPHIRAGVGTAQPLDRAGRSWKQARTLVDEHAHWSLPAGPAWAQEHLPALLLSADPDIAAALRAEALAPLLDLPPERAEPLLATLREWLLRHGARSQVAAALDVHPQTVSYRMDRVRELLGAQLDDVAGSWQILLALMTDRPQVNSSAGQQRR